MDDVRFGPHYVCLALNSGRSGGVAEGPLLTRSRHLRLDRQTLRMPESRRFRATAGRRRDFTQPVYGGNCYWTICQLPSG